MRSTIQHKCKTCGASLLFNPESQLMSCPYCLTLLDVADLKDEDGDLSSVDKNDVLEWSADELQYMCEYQCVSCGGDIYTDDTTSATLCPYCGNAVVLRGRLSGDLKPYQIIPFQISKEKALIGLDVFIGRKRFVHKEFIDKRKLDEVKGLYVPFWAYDSLIHGDMTFDCYNEYSWTEGDYEYTEREYYRVKRIGDMHFNDLPVAASSKVSAEMMESIEPYDHSKCRDFITGYLSGYVADKYDISSESTRPRAEERMFSTVRSEIRSTVNYDVVKVSESAFDMPWCETKYVLYPVWLISSKWNNKMFIFAMNGQSGKTAGNLPVGWSNLLLMSSLIVLLFTGLCSSIPFLNGEGFNPGYLAIGLLIGLTLGIVNVLWYRDQLKSVQYNKNADLYSDASGLSLRIKQDQYLYRKVSKVKIANDDDYSGSGRNKGF